jgi:hypothetical protein
MTYVKMHGRESFSSSWFVEGGFGGMKPPLKEALPPLLLLRLYLHPDMTTVPGDSGAWIYNASTSQLCGHVLAWSDKRKTAYIAPMEVLFEDIKKTLDAEHVSLPTIATKQVEGIVEKVPQRAPQLAETQSAVLNQQLEVSREVELALREMKMSDEASMKRSTKAQERSLVRKDVPDSVQAAVDLKNTSPSLSDRSRTHESGVVR